MTTNGFLLPLAVLGGVLLGMGYALCDPAAGAVTDAPTNAPSAPRADPYVPPAERIPSTTPPSSGEQLKARVLRKLNRDFQLADIDHTGSLTLDQAKRGGLGLVARHFDQIDTQHAGRVTFEQVDKYLRAQGGDF